MLDLDINQEKIEKIAPLIDKKRDENYFKGAKIITNRLDEGFQTEGYIHSPGTYGLIYNSLIELIYKTGQTNGKLILENINKLCDYDHATKFLDSTNQIHLVFAANTEERLFEQIVYIQTALITKYSFLQAKEKFGDTAAEEWLELWGQSMNEQNLAEFKKNELAQNSDFKVTSKNPLKSFLSDFAATSAYGVVSVGALPFVKSIETTEDFLGVMYSLKSVEYGKNLEILMRLAQDLKVDTEERLNLVLWIASSKLNIPLKDVRDMNLSEIEKQIHEQWPKINSENRIRILNFIKKQTSLTLINSLTKIAESSFKVIDIIASRGVTQAL